MAGEVWQLLSALYLFIYFYLSIYLFRFGVQYISLFFIYPWNFLFLFYAITYSLHFFSSFFINFELIQTSCSLTYSSTSSFYCIFFWFHFHLISIYFILMLFGLTSLSLREKSFFFVVNYLFILFNSLSLSVSCFV